MTVVDSAGPRGGNLGRLPAFWVSGAPGAGKSVTAWALFHRLAEAGITVGYVDIDQLGMLYPASAADPMRHRLKSQALAGMAANYRAAGAQIVVVSGVVDPDRGPALDPAATLDVTLCVLAPAAEELVERIEARGTDGAEVRKVVAADAALRGASFVDVVTATNGLSVPQVAARLCELVTIADPISDVAIDPVRSKVGVPALLLTGPRAVGLSAVGFGLATKRWRSDRPTGFIDLGQLSFLAGPAITSATRSTLVLAQLAVAHELMASRGAELVVINGHLSPPERMSVADVLPRATVIGVRLRADGATLRAHIRARAAGAGARLAGDDLAGSDEAYQQSLLARAEADQAAAECDERLTDVIVDVSGRPSADIVSEIEQLVSTAR